MQRLRSSRGVRALASSLVISFLRFRQTTALIASLLAGSAHAPSARSEGAPHDPTIVGAAAISAAPSARPAEWGYGDRDGSTRWARLSPAYASCAHSDSQSPIELGPPIASEGSGAANDSDPIEMAYQSSSLRIAHHDHVTDILDNGHTIQVSVDEGSRLTTPRDVYVLKQFHFHTPGEHTIDGRRAAMEIHYVHQSASGRFAVVAGLFNEGDTDPDLARLIEHLPGRPGESIHRPAVWIDPRAHLPAGLVAWSYRGSFTTRPCTEDVVWFVLRKRLHASRAQIEAFAEMLDGNARPIQARGDRPLVLRALAPSGGS